MPTYEYLCSACRKELEVEQSIREEPLRVCPACGATSLERLISKSTFSLKGGGWYADGYGGGAGSKEKSETKTEAKSEAKSETKSETKTESKAEAKSETKADPKPAVTKE